jgi:hypothetical protein
MHSTLCSVPCPQTRAFAVPEHGPPPFHSRQLYQGGANYGACIVRTAQYDILYGALSSMRCMYEHTVHTHTMLCSALLCSALLCSVLVISGCRRFHFYRGRQASCAHRTILLLCIEQLRPMSLVPVLCSSCMGACMVIEIPLACVWVWSRLLWKSCRWQQNNSKSNVSGAPNRGDGDCLRSGSTYIQCMHYCCCA